MRKERVPTYIALADDFQRRIENGTLEKGQKLPSERRLCAQTGLSRGTVKSMFEELESRGLCVRLHGSGTYVGAAAVRHRGDTAEMRLKENLYELFQLGFSALEILEMAKQQAWDRLEPREKPRVVFLGDCEELAESVVRETAAQSGLSVTGVLFSQFDTFMKGRRKAPGTLVFMASSEEYQRALQCMEKYGFDHRALCGAVCGPGMETVKELVLLAPYSRILVLYESQAFLRTASAKIRGFSPTALIEGIPLPEAAQAAREQPQARLLLAAERHADLLAASPLRAAVRQNGGKEVAFRYVPDRGSLRSLVQLAIKTWLKRVCV